MLFHILQTVTPEAEKIAQRFSTDSLHTKGAEIAEILRNTPPKELIEEMVTSFIKFGIKLIFALVLYVVGAWLIRKSKKFIARVFTRRGADATLTSFMQSLVTAVLWILLIMFMIGTLGINTTSLAALLAAGGMAIGMAMSGTVQNFAGGLMLLAFKPFKAGDYIEAQGFAGVVKSINIVSTKIVTLDNREVILPNGALSNGTINNYSANPLRRIDLTVGVSYGSDAEARGGQGRTDADHRREREDPERGNSGRAGSERGPERAERQFRGVSHPRMGAFLRHPGSALRAHRGHLHGPPGARNLLPVPAAGHSLEA